MACIDAASKEVKAQPTPLVLKLCLIREHARAESLAQIFCLNKLCLRIDLAYGAHAENRRAALHEQRARKAQGIIFVRIPVAVESAESRSGERLVDGRVLFYPWITQRHRARIRGKLFGKVGIEQARVSRPAPVMQEANDGTNI
jgi:hypothetical protein